MKESISKGTPEVRLEESSPSSHQAGCKGLKIQWRVKPALSLPRGPLCVVEAAAPLNKLIADGMRGVLDTIGAHKKDPALSPGSEEASLPPLRGDRPREGMKRSKPGEEAVSTWTGREACMARGRRLEKACLFQNTERSQCGWRREPANRWRGRGG